MILLFTLVLSALYCVGCHDDGLGPLLPDHLPEVNSGIGERGLQRGGGRREGERERQGERERGRERGKEGGKMGGGGNMRVPLDQLFAEQL